MKKAIAFLFLFIGLYFAYKLLGLWSIVFTILIIVCLSVSRVGKQTYKLPAIHEELPIHQQAATEDISYNPATGSPLVGDVDVAGNFFGFNRNK